MPRSKTDPIQLLEQAEGFRRRAESSFGEYALEAGRLLIAAKKRIPHGQWLEHLGEHTSFSSRTAELYMRARKRFDALPDPEKQEVLNQPFTRSLLVLTPGSRSHAQPGDENGIAPSSAPVGLKEKAGQTVVTLPDETLPAEIQSRTAADVEEFLAEHGVDATALQNEALAYHAPAVEHEETPLDDILDNLPPSEQLTELQNQLQDAVSEFEQASEEIAKLERNNRELRQQVEALKASGGQPTKGWDFIANLAMYLKADEAQRTPETLARRAATLPGGRETIAYLEQFFGATRHVLMEIAS